MTLHVASLAAAGWLCLEAGRHSSPVATAGLLVLAAVLAVLVLVDLGVAVMVARRSAETEAQARQAQVAMWRRRAVMARHRARLLDVELTRIVARSPFARTLVQIVHAPEAPGRHEANP